jgi:hypothetical protein
MEAQVKEELKAAIRTLFENELQVTDGGVTLFCADGVFMTEEDPEMWVLVGDEWEEGDFRLNYYKEFSSEEDAIDFFLEGNFEWEKTPKKKVGSSTMEGAKHDG